MTNNTNTNKIPYTNVITVNGSWVQEPDVKGVIHNVFNRQYFVEKGFEHDLTSWRIMVKLQGTEVEREDTWTQETGCQDGPLDPFKEVYVKHLTNLDIPADREPLSELVEVSHEAVQAAIMAEREHLKKEFEMRMALLDDRYNFVDGCVPDEAYCWREMKMTKKTKSNRRKNLDARQIPMASSEEVLKSLPSGPPNKKKAEEAADVLRQIKADRLDYLDAQLHKVATYHDIVFTKRGGEHHIIFKSHIEEAQKELAKARKDSAFWEQLYREEKEFIKGLNQKATILQGNIQKLEIHLQEAMQAQEKGLTAAIKKLIVSLWSKLKTWWFHVGDSLSLFFAFVLFLIALVASSVFIAAIFDEEFKIKQRIQESREECIYQCARQEAECVQSPSRDDYKKNEAMGSNNLTFTCSTGTTRFTIPAE